MMQPWGIQVELTRGCTRRCKQCGIWAIGDEWKNPRFMTTELADKVSRELGTWMPQGRRVAFALDGEPLLNPDAVEIIRVFRRNYPKAQLTIFTNGDILKKDPAIIDRLFASGLNYLLVDAYESPWLTRKTVPARDCNVFQYNGYKDHKIVLMDNFSEDSWSGAKRRLNNQAGNVREDFARELGITILKEPLRKNCSNVFRDFVIRYDGSVTICCMDWRKECIIGKFPESTLQEIWESPRYNCIRQLLFDKKRLFPPCNRCDYTGFKVGLLKDPKVPKEDVDRFLAENNIKKPLEQTQFSVKPSTVETAREIYENKDLGSSQPQSDVQDSKTEINV